MLEFRTSLNASTASSLHRILRVELYKNLLVSREKNARCVLPRL